MSWKRGFHALSKLVYFKTQLLERVKSSVEVTDCLPLRRFRKGSCCYAASLWFWPRPLALTANSSSPTGPRRKGDVLKASLRRKLGRNLRLWQRSLIKKKRQYFPWYEPYSFVMSLPGEWDRPWKGPVSEHFEPLHATDHDLVIRILLHVPRSFANQPGIQHGVGLARIYIKARQSIQPLASVLWANRCATPVVLR